MRILRPSLVRLRGAEFAACRQPVMATATLKVITPKTANVPNVIRVRCVVGMEQFSQFKMDSR